MTYDQTLDYLYNSLPEFQREGASAYKPGLERTIEFIEHLGSPDRAFRSVHIAGTNGKGSTSHMVAAVLQHAGHRVGLYTSPHLKDFRERIRVDGEMISESDVVDFVAFNRDKMEHLSLSFFEMTVGMAFWYFAKMGVDFAVVEVGLGGRLDSTNVIKPEICAITNIALDHVALLGDTVEKIAFEKAGIMKRGTVCVIGQRSACERVFIDRAEDVGARLLWAEDLFQVEGAEDTMEGQKFAIKNFGDVTLDLLGGYQRKNVLTVLAIVTTLGIEKRVIVEALSCASKMTGLQGRWQVLSRCPLTVADTAHNEDGVREVVLQIARQHYRRLIIVIGMVSDKDSGAVLSLLPREAHYIFVQPDIKRALDADDLCAKAACFSLYGEVIRSVPRAIARAKELASADDMIYIGGSNFVVAEI